MTLLNLFIGIALLLLIIIVLNQLTKLSDTLSGFSRNQEGVEEYRANLYSTLFLVVGVVGIVLLVLSYFDAADRFLPVAASELGRDWTKFFRIYSVPIVVVFFITHFLLFFFAWKYRYKPGRKVFYFPESDKLEIIWTTVPLVTVVVLGVVVLGKWIKATSAPSEDALHIKVTGMQFKWFIGYPGADNEFGSRDIIQYGSIQNLLGLDPKDEKGYDDLYAEEIVIPVNKEIAFDLNALDVIHDFYLPHFRVKMDAIPGVPTRLKITPDRTTAEMREITGNPEFNYELACAELCGTGHWNMKKVVRVVSENEYKDWLSEQMTAKELYYDNLLAKLADNETDSTLNITPNPINNVHSDDAQVGTENDNEHSEDPATHEEETTSH